MAIATHAPRQVESTVAASVRYVAIRSGKTVGSVLISALILGVLWHIAAITSPITSFIVKTPFDVWAYVTQDSLDGTAAAHRAKLAGLLWVTLGHASIGFVVGVAASVLVSIVFTLFRPLEYMFMPLAMLMRTVPLLAMAPVIYVIFGNGTITAALIGTVVVFFPLLVNVTLGLRSVNQQSADLVAVYGGSKVTLLRKVAIPTALPYFFASMRIAVPGAITGAMLYEWLFTFQGLGAAVQSAKAQSDYPLIWAVTVLITLVSIVLYTVATIIEAAVLAKWGPNAGKAPGS